MDGKKWGKCAASMVETNQVQKLPKLAVDGPQVGLNVCAW